MNLAWVGYLVAGVIGLAVVSVAAWPVVRDALARARVATRPAPGPIGDGLLLVPCRPRRSCPLHDPGTCAVSRCCPDCSTNPVRRAPGSAAGR